MVGMQKLKELLELLVENREELTQLEKSQAIIEGFKRANVYVLQKGELENYFQMQNDYNITDRIKDEIFVKERDFLIQSDNEDGINARYRGLVEILDDATKVTIVDYKPALQSRIIDFVHEVKKAVRYEEIKDDESLKSHSKINYSSFKNIIDIVSFSINESGFACEIRIKGFELVNPS